MSHALERRSVKAARILAFAALALALLAPGAAGGRSRPEETGRPIVALEFEGFMPGHEAWSLESPEAFAIDHRGRLLLVDSGNHRVVVVSADGALLGEFGGYGWGADEFDTPTDIAVEKGLSTYVLDEGNRRVSRFDVDGDFLDTPVEPDEAGTPVGLFVDSAGDILLVDSDSQSVRLVSRSSEGIGDVGRFGDDVGSLSEPRDVVRGPGREILVADAGRRLVEVYDEFGSPILALAAADTMVPEALALDGRENVLVCDVYRERLLVFSLATGRVTAELGAPQVGERFRPVGLAFAPDGGILVLDGRGGRVLRVRPVREPGRR